jgi:hypothetical protein
MSDADIARERVKEVVSAEKRMQTGFEDISVAISPRRKFSAENIALFQHDGTAAGIGKIFRGGEPRRASTNDDGARTGIRCVASARAGAGRVSRDEQD